VLRSTKSDSRAFCGPKAGKYPALEDELLTYFEELTNDGIAVTYDMLQLRAGELTKSHDISDNEFKASRGWLQRFMKRKGLSLCRTTTLCQKLPRDFTDNVINFHRHVIRMREEHSYLLSQIGNADQTPVFFYMPRNTSIEKQGMRSVTIKTTGAEKQRCTVMLAVTADGGKLPPHAIFKTPKREISTWNPRSSAGKGVDGSRFSEGLGRQGMRQKTWCIT
jgi:hypothetical protein